MGFLFGSGKKQAKAITESAALQAASDREAARGAELSRETMIAQDRAARSAEELLSKPQGKPEVDLVSTDSGSSFDPTTGKRRTRRQTYSVGGGTASSGVQL